MTMHPVVCLQGRAEAAAARATLQQRRTVRLVAHPPSHLPTPQILISLPSNSPGHISLITHSTFCLLGFFRSNVCRLGAHPPRISLLAVLQPLPLGPHQVSFIRLVTFVSVWHRFAAAFLSVQSKQLCKDTSCQFVSLSCCLEEELCCVITGHDWCKILSLDVSSSCAYIYTAFSCAFLLDTLFFAFFCSLY